MSSAQQAWNYRLSLCHRGALALLFMGSLALAGQSPAPLNWNQRVEAQAAMERVYYAHRIWPKENPSSKPPF